MWRHVESFARGIQCKFPVKLLQKNILFLQTVFDLKNVKHCMQVIYSKMF